jgi:hypothetical protein
MKKFNQILKTAALPVMALSLVACSDNDDDPVTKEFQVSIINLSQAQPLSPVAAVLHQDEFAAWQLSQPASNGLEVLAEGGDNSDFLTEAQANETQYLTHVSSEGVLLPGVSTSLSLSSDHEGTVELTLATMLVNTNDAFAGVTGVDLTDLTVGETARYNLPVYDAGTEFNSEESGTIPGPADGGEGYNAERDDIADQVTRHPGVVSEGVDGGLDENPLSTLQENHRFDAPIARIVVTRLN